jgi:hypothetical protein
VLRFVMKQVDALTAKVLLPLSGRVIKVVVRWLLVWEITADLLLHCSA